MRQIEMQGVSGLNMCSGGDCCDTCAFADISDKPRVIVLDNMRIVQNSGHNVVCTNKSIAKITLTDEGMTCSGWRARE